MFNTIRNLIRLSKNMDVLDKKQANLEPKKEIRDNLEDDFINETKRYKHELKKTEFELKRQELELEKLQRLQELEIRREELKSLKQDLLENKSSGGTTEDFLLTQLLGKIMDLQPKKEPVIPLNPPIPTNEPQPHLKNGDNIGLTTYFDQPIEKLSPEPDYIPQTRFTNEQLREMIPQLFDKKQITSLKQINLNDDETLQVMDLIKTL
jgi:hypothetical protein